MRISRASAAFFWLCAAGPAAALEDTRLDWGRNDTALHLGTSFGGTLLATEALEWWGWSTPRAVLASSLAMAAGGLMKEFVLDSAASGNDLMADGIGIGANALLQFSVRF